MKAALVTHRDMPHVIADLDLSHAQGPNCPGNSLTFWGLTILASEGCRQFRLASNQPDALVGSAEWPEGLGPQQADFLSGPLATEASVSFLPPRLKTQRSNSS